jgi:hypothetical protein
MWGIFCLPWHRHSGKRNYGFTSHSKDEETEVKWLAQGQKLIWRNIVRRDFFYTLVSALEFLKIFRGGWEKIKIQFNFLPICSLSKMGKLKYSAECDVTHPFFVSFIPLFQTTNLILVIFNLLLFYVNSVRKEGKKAIHCTRNTSKTRPTKDEEGSASAAVH